MEITKNWFLFYKGDVFLEKNPTDGALSVPRSPQIPFGDIGDAIPVPEMRGFKSFALEVKSPECPPNLQRVGLRDSYDCLDKMSYQMAGKAEELLHWHLSTRHCGYCGGEMKFTTDISKTCTSCHREIWPTLSPAIIVLIRRRDEILLVQSRTFKSDYYGLVAGFVETGESLENCVYREVKEETNLEITNLHYFASQPWPYPRGLMAGFTADYLGGELHLQFSELNKGGWFRLDNMPRIPRKLSMARRLIDYWISEQKGLTPTAM